MLRPRGGSEIIALGKQRKANHNARQGRPGNPQKPWAVCRVRLHAALLSRYRAAAANFLQQQARFDKFIDIFNNERPHEALDMKCPAEVYQPSTRPYTGLPDIDYPFHDKTIVVTRGGRICLGRKKINFSQVFAGQAVDIEEVHDDVWLVSFMEYDLGYFDRETRVLEPLENPFGPKVYLCLRYVVSPMSPGRTNLEWSGRVDLNHRPPGPEPRNRKP